MIMAAAKALTIVDRWEVGGGERERKKRRACSERRWCREKKMNSEVDI